MAAPEILVQTQLGERGPDRKGKVRDIFEIPSVHGETEQLLLVASDRLSAFDVVLPTGIPWKGTVLTQLSLFWFDLTKDIIPNHYITSSVADYPEPFASHRAALRGRSMITRKAKVTPIECVVRGYLAGSSWKEYQQSQSVCGIKLPAGLRESDKLPHPLFTPATKQATGHDENVSFERVAELVGSDTARQLRDASLAVYEKGSSYAASCGIILADTKFELGFVDDGCGGDRLILVDEVLTPDSSRFWDAESYQPGGPQDSFDKQYVRDYLETLSWGKTYPGPELPSEVVVRTSEKYREAFRRIVGKELCLADL